MRPRGRSRQPVSVLKQAAQRSGSPPAGTSRAGRGPERRGVVLAPIGAAIIIGAAMIMALGTHPPNGGNLGRDVDPPQPLRDFRLPIMANRSALPTLPGANLTLSKLRGRPVLLSFWASWCPPCRRDAPRIEAAWRVWRDRGLIVIGVDTNDASNAALAFTHQAGLTFPIVRDGSNTTAGGYGLLGLPEAFLLDRRGRTHVHWIGELSETDLMQQIARLAKHQADRARTYQRNSPATPWASARLRQAEHGTKRRH